jgi:hypothetical protein
MPSFNFSAPRAFSPSPDVGTLPFQRPLASPYVITSDGGATLVPVSNSVTPTAAEAMTI